MAINPLQPAINYMGMLPQIDLGRSFAELGATLEYRQDMLRKQEEARRAEEAKKAFADDLNAARTAGTQEAWLGMIAKYPQFREAFSEVRKGVGEERVKNDFFSGFEISNALENKRPEVAAQKLQTIIAAKKQAGEPTGLYESVLSRIEAGDIDVAQASVNEILAITDPERYEKTVKAKLQPLKLRQETADAIIKEAEAKFAPQRFGLEIDLTKSQIEQARAARRAQDAAAAKSGAEAARARAEADKMAAGIIPADKRPEAETKFRKEYSDQTKGYQEVKSAYGRVLSSEDNAVGDLSLIFGYMKMLDPGSVVREGEFATAQNAAGVPERIQNVYNKVISGERLSASQRNAFKGQAGKLYTTAQQQEAQVRQGIERIAKGYGLKTENIFYTPTEQAPTAPGAPAPAPGATVSVTAPNGQVLTFPSQQAADAFKKAAGIR